MKSLTAAFALSMLTRIVVLVYDRDIDFELIMVWREPVIECR